jgi:hypothetical protein
MDRRTVLQKSASRDQEEGPLCYEYGQAVIDGAPTPSAVEYALMTDSEVFGEDPDGYGPFRLINTIAGRARRGECHAAIVLRVETPWGVESSPDLRPMDETETSRYHGGGINDEITALVSLELGIRLKPGRLIRDFRITRDPRGRPRESEYEQNPILLTGGRTLILPYSVGQRNLNNVQLLRSMPRLQPGSAVALVRAARLYQDALWIAEAEPNLAWVMFVSAIEAAAQYWKVADVSPADLLKEVDPRLYDILLNGGEPFLEQVAGEIAHLMKATRKFISFIKSHLPDPPSQRPPEAFQHKWSRNSLGDSLSTIYNHRSRALHNGTPFPLPMCEPPNSYADGSGMPPEVPFGEAYRSLGATWVKKDMPMLLHTFEYIVRNVLLQWWRSMLPE